MMWIQENWGDVLFVITSIISVTSVVVRLTPTLKDDSVWLPIIRFLSKYIAINTPTPTKRPQ